MNRIRRRWRKHRPHVIGALPSAVMLGSWAALGAPGIPVSGIVVACLCAVSYPAAALCSPAFPACLRSRASRERRRKGQHEPSDAIPSWLHRIVLIADRRACAYRHHHRCYGPPHVDHVIPWAGGGLASIINLGVLCETANMIKSGYRVSRDGFVKYRPWPGYDDKVMAARILAAERWRQRNPLRYLLAVLALALR